MASAIPPQQGSIITAVRYIKDAPGMVKLVIFSRVSLRAELCAGAGTYPECRNRIEPYDFLTHVFRIPSGLLLPQESFTLNYSFNEDEGAFRRRVYVEGAFQFRYESEAPEDPDVISRAALNGLALKEHSTLRVAGGVEYIQSLYLDRQGLPVRTFALVVDTAAAGFIVGTPDDGYEALERRQPVHGQMRAALAHGRRVIAAVNGDFFDMFGNFAPSGPCVKDGRTVFMGDERRPVLGLTDEGTPFIGELSEGRQRRGRLAQAVGGMPQILKDGMPHELLAGEPFGDIRHPRTAAGLGHGGQLILLVVDGRIPEHSNGVSLGDLALLMREMGANDALNLDGGGSSILILNQDGELKTMNRPADLVRPMDNLIREVFNTLIIVAK